MEHCRTKHWLLTTFNSNYILDYALKRPFAEYMFVWKGL